MTTKPFLYLDLDLLKSWREEMHPRDKHGRFTTVKGGSRVATKTGKTGVVSKVTDSHYHVNYDDGTSGRLLKDNVLHANDHEKAVKAQKKKKAVAKKAGKKQSATKAQTKANGTAKAKAVKDPTVKAPAKKATAIRKGATVHTSTGRVGKVSGQSADGKKWLIDTEDGKKIRVNKENVTHANDVKKPAPKKVTASKPKTTTAKKTTPAKATKATKATKEAVAPKVESAKPKATTAKKTPKAQSAVEQQLQGGKEFANAHIELPKSKGVTVDSMWASKAVQDVMKQAPEKRNPETIRQLAGQITQENDKLAHSLVNRRLKAMGLPQMKNKIGNVATKNPFTYETGLHADMLQSARGAMYETLLATMAGSQNPGSEMGAHVVNRMKDKVTKDLYGFMNAIPAPHEIRPAIRAMKSAESELSQQIGRTPNDEELGAYLEATSKHFQQAPINKPPRWDEKTNDWIAGRGRIEDPTERLKTLRQYDAIQRTASADTHIGSDGEREVTISQNAVDEGRSPEEAYERKERQRELEGALPKAMRAIKMHPASVKVWTMTHSEPSAKRNQPYLTGDEVADKINAEGGWEGKPVSRSWVAKWYKSGRESIAQAWEDKHPALTQLQSLFKSFVFTEMLRAIYEYDLVKSLHSWGFDATILRQKFVRTESGRNLFDIKKSLAPTEYIGSYVTTDSGYVHARIVGHDVPKGEELVKAFQEFEELSKALFGHKDGGNHAVNQKATDYVKSNSKKYSGMANDQQKRVKSKGGNLTWSEQLLLDNPGSCWISWGGKKLLVNGSTGEIHYDSKNESHRADVAEKRKKTVGEEISTQEDKLDFHHEADEHEARSKELMEQAKKDHAEGKYTLKGGRSKQAWADHHGVKMQEVTDESGKKDLVPHLDEEGNLQFDHSSRKFTTDHGVQAFEESLGDLEKHMKEHKAPHVQALRHKLVSMHHGWADEDKEAFHNASDEDRAKMIGDHIAQNEHAMDFLNKAKDMLDNGATADDVMKELADDMNALGGRSSEHNLNVLGNKGKLKPVLNKLKKDGNMDEALEYLGRQELSRAQDEANKKLMPEGHYEVGNKATGKSMVVKVAHREDPESGKYVAYVEEAFDPKTGKHFTSPKNIDKSWGQLGKELGLPHNSSEKYVMDSNKAGSDAVVTTMDEDEANNLRSHTTLGMRDNMLHKDFAKVSERRDKANNLVSTTYAQDMPDGTQNVIEVGADGYIKDPIMARLVGNSTPITNANELHEALQNAVGRKTWVTAHFGQDVHIGDALGHHVQLMYDGKGAPRVVGGAYDGYRFMDEKDVPKGATDPHTGEPIKALFKNGKLIDRKFSHMQDVAMKRGNSVMYPDGDKMRKGKIARIREDGTMEIHNSKGQLVGLFKKNELKPAREKGNRAVADSGQAVVKLKEQNAHTMNASEAFGDNEKVKDLFKQALTKAGIKGHVDKETGELNSDIELNDAQHQALKKVLGRSKAGRAIMSQFTSSARPAQLELHVPDHMKAQVEAEGVKVGADGTTTISAGKFESLRDALGGLSIDHKAQNYLKDHFRRKDRVKRNPEELKKDYQPFMAEGHHADHYKKQFKPGSFLSEEYITKKNADGTVMKDDKGNPVYDLDENGNKKPGGLYNTQLQGVSHLVERGRGIAGHGINSTLAMTLVA